MTDPVMLRYINPSGLAAPRGYSHVVEVTGGRTIYISGQIALDEHGQIVGWDDIAAQAEQVFHNLNLALAAVGSDFRHVVKLTFFLIDISQLPAVRAVRDRYVDTSHPPASTAVEIGRLALDGLLLEVEAIASLPA